MYISYSVAEQLNLTNVDYIDFWTWQSPEVYNILLNEGEFNPVFSQSSKQAYLYILNKYREITGYDSNGLVFGHVGSSYVGNVKTELELNHIIDEIGNPPGSKGVHQVSHLLHLRIPITYFMMGIDYYRFSDLLYFMNEDTDPDQIQMAKQYLFMPNGVDNMYELIVGHVDCLKEEWLVKQEHKTYLF